MSLAALGELVAELREHVLSFTLLHGRWRGPALSFALMALAIAASASVAHPL